MIMENFQNRKINFSIKGLLSKTNLILFSLISEIFSYPTFKEAFSVKKRFTVFFRYLVFAYLSDTYRYFDQ